MVFTTIYDTKSHKGSVVLTDDKEDVNKIAFVIVGRFLHIMTIETKEEKRNNGLATSSLNHLINMYGEKYDIMLSCMPFPSSMYDNFKIEQEKLSHFYEKFGFVTTKKEKHYNHYTWNMIRKRKEK